MRKFALYFFLLIGISLLSFVFFYHQPPVKLNSVIVPGKFSISIPEYLAKTDSIDPSALLQYKNEKEEIFMLIYENDTTHASLHEFFKNRSGNFISKVGHGNLLKYFPLKINGLNAFAGNIRGTIRETGVYYRLAAIECSGKYYEILIGITENKKNLYDNDLNNIINSFSSI